MGFPCLAVHDFQLIPSLRTAHDPERRLIEGGNWIRHSIDAPFADGAMGVRSIEIDFSSEFFRQLFPNYKWTAGVKAEWVFEDLVMAMGWGALLPLPLQATLGVRRNIENFTQDTDIFAFDKAPLDFFLFDNKIHVRVYQMLFRTMPSGLQANVQLGFAFGDDPLDETKQQDWEIRFEFDEKITVRLGAVWLPDDDFPLRIRYSDDLIADPFAISPGFSIGKAMNGKDFFDCAELVLSVWLHDKKAKLQPGGVGSGSPAGGGGSGTVVLAAARRPAKTSRSKWKRPKTRRFRW